MKRGSAIVNTGSVTGLLGNSDLLDYSMTKGGIHAFTRSLAAISFRAACASTPSPPVRLDAAESVDKEGEDVAISAPTRRCSAGPAGGDRARVVFLASPQCSSYITGEILPIIGGTPAAEAGFFRSSRKEEQAHVRLVVAENHAISILKRDHDDAKKLFDEFEATDSSAARERIVARAVEALKIHAVLEEEIFYPAVRAHVGAEIMDEADEEHHVAKVLIGSSTAERRTRTPAGEIRGPRRKRPAPHPQEETDAPEGEGAADRFEGWEPDARAQEGTEGKRHPAAPEAEMVAKAGRNADSPAAAARRPRAAGAPASKRR